MPPAARVTDNHICPMFDGPKPHVGGPILPAGCPTVLIGGLPAARVGDLATCVGPPDVIVMGSPTVLIGGQPAARIGDNTAHGGVIVVGHPTVLIGIPGQGDCLKKAADAGAPFVQNISGKNAVVTVKGQEKQSAMTGAGKLKAARYLKSQGVPKKVRREIIGAFGDDIKVETLKQDTQVNRYYGGESKPQGRWVTKEKVSEPVNDLALPPGSTAEKCAIWTIPKGTTVLTGSVAPRWGHKGGASQVYLTDASVLK